MFHFFLCSHRCEFWLPCFPPESHFHNPFFFCLYFNCLLSVTPPTSLHHSLLHIRMRSLLAWRCFCPKRPSCTRKPASPFNTMSSSTRLPIMETLHLSPPPLMWFPYLLKHQSLPKRQNPLKTPRSTCTVTVNPSLGGTPLLAVTPYPAATSLQTATPHLDVTPPLTPHTNACRPAPPPHLSWTGPGLRRPAQTALSPGGTVRGDTFTHRPPHLILPSCLHHRPRWSTARSAPARCPPCRDHVCIHLTNLQTWTHKSL